MSPTSPTSEPIDASRWAFFMPESIEKALNFYHVLGDPLEDPPSGGHLEGRAMQGFRPQRVGDRFTAYGGSRPYYPYRGEEGVLALSL